MASSGEVNVEIKADIAGFIQKIEEGLAKALGVSVEEIRAMAADGRLPIVLGLEVKK